MKIIFESHTKSVAWDGVSLYSMVVEYDNQGAALPVKWHTPFFVLNMLKELGGI